MAVYKPGRPSRREPPEKPGEYRYRNKETGDVEYIGESSNLSKRDSQHEKSDEPFGRETHYFEWKAADGRYGVESRRDHERKKIEEHNPRYNQRAGGAGRKPKR